jgi:hypothetical protein
MPSKTGPYTVNDDEGYAEVTAMRKRGARPEPRPRDISRDVDANSGNNADGSKPIRKG